METKIIPLTQTGREIIWEHNVIKISFDTENERDKRIFNLINNLQKKIDVLEKEKFEFNFLSLTNEQAKEKIVDYLKSKKIEGHGKIEVFQISCELKIPAVQVEEIIEDLQKEEIVKEI
ncbi:MAG: hypothetical protein WC979_10150 [Candidatus Pacearchaeota archaeon]|jgi:hypothetical protein